MSIQVKMQFKPLTFVFSVCGLAGGLLLGVAGKVQAQAPYISPVTKSHVTFGDSGFTTYLDFSYISDDCHHNGSTSLTYSGDIEIPATANQNDPVGSWMEYYPDDWTCRRQFFYATTVPSMPVIPECGVYGNNLTGCWPQINTRLRHWLDGSVPAFTGYQVAGSVSIDGVTYTVYRKADWTGSHAMAGLGFVVRWETTINGTPYELPIDVGYAGDVYRRGVPVEVIWPNNHDAVYGIPNSNPPWYATNTKISFRMVLLDPGPENIQNSDNNDFYVTQKLNLARDHCQPKPNWPICEQTSQWSLEMIDFKANLNIRHQNPTCTAENLVVPMGNIPLTSFLTANAIGGETFFEIKLTCPRVIRRNMDYSLSASSGTSPNPNIGLVPLAGSSTATGVDVQILDASKTALALDTFHSAYTWAPGHTPVSEVKIPLYAQLRRKGNDTVMPGGYTAAATVLIQYP